MKKIPELTPCKVCQRKFILEPICDNCRNKNLHHQRKVPKGVCQQCLEKDLPLTKVWNNKYYCKDCQKWNQEGEQSGIGTYGQRFSESYCNNCGECTSCLKRKDLAVFSTRDLMIEVINRPEFEALLSWEDDGFKQRYGEIMWELDQVKGWTLKRIEKAVNRDIFAKKISQRKFSRRT